MSSMGTIPLSSHVAEQVYDIVADRLGENKSHTLLQYELYRSSTSKSQNIFTTTSE